MHEAECGEEGGRDVTDETAEKQGSSASSGRWNESKERRRNCDNG